MTELYLDPKPLLDAARNGRPWHTEPHCVACTRNVTSDQALCITVTEVAQLLGVSTKTIHGWRAGTGRRVRGLNAEQLANACNRLDYEIWPQLLEHAIDQVTRTCANPECATTFTPKRSDQKYCTRPCKDSSPAYRAHRARTASRVRKVRSVTEPEWYAARLEANREYKAEVRARQRERTAA